MAMTTEHGLAEGEVRKLQALDITSSRNTLPILQAQIAMLRKALARADLTCTSDDIADALEAEYEDGGSWVGAAVRRLRTAGITRRVGQCVSARPSRHATEIKLWQVVDEARARTYLAQLRAQADALTRPLPESFDESLFPILSESERARR